MLYELRHYDANSIRGLDTVVQRFAEHTIRIWDRFGIEPVGFWTVTVGAPAPRLTYLLAWEDLAQRQERWDAFSKDPEWLEIRAETNASAGGNPIHTISNSILAPTDYSPQPRRDNQPTRLHGGAFELRTWTFRDPDHMALSSEWIRDKGMPHLIKHHIYAMGYWTTVIGVMPRMTYILVFENLAHREHAWATLYTDPEWTALQDGLYSNGTSLLAGVESCLMKGTAFSGWR
jgi:hypothetical protein